MIYGYARVSSIGQAKDGNSLEAQEKTLREHGCSEIYKETFTGTTTDRPELLIILGKIQKRTYVYGCLRGGIILSFRNTEWSMVGAV